MAKESIVVQYEISGINAKSHEGAHKNVTKEIKNACTAHGWTLKEIVTPPQGHSQAEADAKAAAYMDDEDS